MPTVKAAGYLNAATSAQAGQILYNRGHWDCTVQAAADKILISKLPAGHRLLPELCSIYGNALTPAMNVDVCISLDANVLINDFALAGATANRAGVAASAVPYTLAETLGVDYENDRDVYLLINSGAATAPAGSKVVAVVASIAAARPD